MTIHLPPSLERSIRDAVHSGRYASLDDAMTDAASLLVQRLTQEQTQTQPKPPAANQDVDTSGYKPIWELAAEIRKSVPPEEWEKLRHFSPIPTTRSTCSKGP